MLFLQFSYFLMLLNIQIDLIIWKTCDQQFTFATKKSLHITFKGFWWTLLHFFGEQKFSTAGILRTFCQSATKFGSVGSLADGHLFPEFDELWSGGFTMPCGNMSESFTDALLMFVERHDVCFARVSLRQQNYCKMVADKFLCNLGMDGTAGHSLLRATPLPVFIQLA